MTPTNGNILMGVMALVTLAIGVGGIMLRLGRIIGIVEDTQSNVKEHGRRVEGIDNRVTRIEERLSFDPEIVARIGPKRRSQHD